MPPKPIKSKQVRRGRTLGEDDDSYTSGDDAPKLNRSKSSRRSIDEGIGHTVSDNNESAPVINSEIEKQPGGLKEDLDKYCKMCDDGGNLVECDRCRFSFCYDEVACLPDDYSGETPIPHACISVPKGYLLDPFKVFYCPECLTEHPELPFDYQINRGYRTTQRRVVNFQLVLLLCYLPSLEERAKKICESIRAVIGGLEVANDVFLLPLPQVLHDANRSWILTLEYPYHLIFIFFTESNPGGGWWIGTDSQTDEAAWLTGLVTLYTDIAEKAVTARIFGLCCGLNLYADQTIQAISASFSGSHWDSIMLPTASSILPEELCSIFPELFGQLYYNGITLKSAVVRVWATSLRARVHTDILIFESLNGCSTVQKYRYGSFNNRPYGVDLPAPWSFCSCARNGTQVKWKRKAAKVSFLHNEFMLRYKTTCDHVHLDVAVFTGAAHIKEAVGVQLIVEDFDPQLRLFPLDSPDSYAIRPFLGEAKSKGAEHESAWTTYGKLHNVSNPTL